MPNYALKNQQRSRKLYLFSFNSLSEKNLKFIEFSYKKKFKKMISYSFKKNNKSFKIRSLYIKDLKKLYFFFQKFDDFEKHYFGFPLFKPITITFNKMRLNFIRYKKKEQSHWRYFLLFHRKKIIGLAYVKKIGFKNKKKETNKSPTMGGPFVLKKNRGVGLGNIMMKLCIYQIKLMGKKYLYCRIISKNKIAIRNALKCGFKMTGKKYKVRKNLYDFELKKLVN